MQILQWLFKVVQEKQAREKKIPCHAREESKELVSYKNHKVRKRSRKNDGIELDCRDLNRYLALLFRSGNSTDYFYRILNQRRLNNYKNLVHQPLYIYSMKMKKEDIVRGLASIRHSKLATAQQPPSSSPATAATHHAGNKVLPITENSASSSSRTQKDNDQNDHLDSSDQNDHLDSSDQKNGKTRTVSRMKELLRWAAAAKSQKGGKYIGRRILHFRNRGNPKGLPCDEFTSESPKISFRWDVESCTTTSSAISASSMPPLMNAGRSDHYQSDDPRKGNWITTDDEFVVLEL